MKNNLVRLNNKGAALISIMIAVAFISILASAFLYMSYNNFTMKVTNYESKQNFYDTEQHMMNLSAKLRSEIMASSDPLTELKTLAGVDASGRYDATKLAQLAFDTTPSGNANFASVSYDSNVFNVTTKLASGANYTETPVNANITKVTLHGININKRDSVTDAVNSLTTDFVMYIEKHVTSEDSGGIGEFSFLVDSPLAITGEGTKLNIFGNCFAMNTVQEGGKSMPGCYGSGKQALNLRKESSLNVLGDQMIVYGDVVIEENATLNIIDAELTVFGDIYLLGQNSNLICTGMINFPSQQDTRNNSGMGGQYEIYVSNGGSFSNDPNLVKKHILPHSFSVNRLPDASMDSVMTYLHCDNSDATDDGIVNSITQKQNGKAFDESDFCRNGPSTDKIRFGLKDYYAMANKEQNFNGGIHDCLVFNTVDAKMKYENINSTFISRKSISFEEVHTVTVTKMGTHSFNYLIAPDGSVNFTPKHNFKNNLADSNTYSIGGFFKDDANVQVGMLLGSSSGNSGTVDYESSMGYQNWIKE